MFYTAASFFTVPMTQLSLFSCYFQSKCPDELHSSVPPVPTFTASMLLSKNQITLISSFYLSFYLSFFFILAIYLSILLFLDIYLSFYLCLSTYLSFDLSIFLPIYPPFSVCLSISLYQPIFHRHNIARLLLIHHNFPW